MKKRMLTSLVTVILMLTIILTLTTVISAKRYPEVGGPGFVGENPGELSITYHGLKGYYFAEQAKLAPRALSDEITSATPRAKNSDAHKISGGGVIDSGNGPVTCAFTAKQVISDEYGVYGAKGQIVVKPHYEDVLVKATIVSLAVAGNDTWIGGIVTQSNLSVIDVGAHFILKVLDNGEGKDAPDFDRMSNYEFGSADASLMPDLDTDYYYWTIGNIQVH